MAHRFCEAVEGQLEHWDRRLDRPHRRVIPRPLDHGVEPYHLAEVALDSAEQIYLFWITDDDTPPYLNNLCRSWNDALDNFEYRPLPASALQSLGDHLDDQLPAPLASGFDFYICARESLRAQCAQYAERRSIPARQMLFETI